MRLPPALGLGLVLAAAGCTESNPPSSYDGGWGDFPPLVPGSGTGDAGGADGSTQDGGTGRCTVLPLDLYDSADAVGLGLAVAARSDDFLVSWASRDPSVNPPSNVYLRSVGAALGSLGTTNGYLLSDALVGGPAILPRTSGVLLAYSQTFTEVGALQIDVVTQHVDLSLGADANAQRAATTTADETAIDGVTRTDQLATVAMLSTTVDVSSTSATTSLAFGDLDVDGLFAYGPVEIAGTTDVAAPPAVAELGGSAFAAFRRSTGTVELVELQHATEVIPTAVAVATSGHDLDLAGDASGGALVFDASTLGRSVVRFLPLGATGSPLGSAVDVNAAPIAAADGAVALLGAQRLVVYRATVDGSTYVLRASVVDATGHALSDQVVATGIAGQGQVEVASNGSGRALVVFAERGSSATGASAGYRVRGALLGCP